MTLVDNSSTLNDDQPKFCGGLAFMGLTDDREAYALPFPIPLSSKSLGCFRVMAESLNGEIDFTPNLCIYRSKDLPLIEICDGQTVSYLLVASDCHNKAALLQSCFEALIYGLVR